MFPLELLRLQPYAKLGELLDFKGQDKNPNLGKVHHNESANRKRHPFQLFLDLFDRIINLCQRDLAA